MGSMGGETRVFPPYKSQSRFRLSLRKAFMKNGIFKISKKNSQSKEKLEKYISDKDKHRIFK